MIFSSELVNIQITIWSKLKSSPHPHLTLGSFKCIAVNDMDALLVIRPTLAKDKQEPLEAGVKEASYQQRNRWRWRPPRRPSAEGQGGSFLRLRAGRPAFGRTAETWCALLQACLQARGHHSKFPLHLGEWISVFSYTVRDLRSQMHKSKPMSEVKQSQRIAREGI